MWRNTNYIWGLLRSDEYAQQDKVQHYSKTLWVNVAYVWDEGCCSYPVLQKTKYLGANAKNRVELEANQRVHRRVSAASNRETSEFEYGSLERILLRELFRK